MFRKTVSAAAWSLHRAASTSSSTMSQSPPSEAVSALYKGLVAGERQALARAITLVESTNRKHRSDAIDLLHMAEADARQKQEETSFRIGLSGPPGAGKSTFIEAFGTMLCDSGKHRVAVLAVDPSSGTTGGSLLGDKTRMPDLTRNPRAFIRPSPSGRGHMGGVTRRMNEAVALCEAAGYDVVLVETVGVGQSEYLVADMVDLFCLVIPPAGGDELQGIKRGIVEQSDLVVVNKCDGDLVPAARRIKAEYTSALKYMRRKHRPWRPKVKMVSSLNGDGLDDVWETMIDFREVMTDGEEEGDLLAANRAKQREKWMWSYVNYRLADIFAEHTTVNSLKGNLQRDVREYRVSPGAAADVLINAFMKDR